MAQAPDNLTLHRQGPRQSGGDSKPRVLILISACHTRKTLDDLVGRIPERLTADYDVHALLIVDDASPESIFAGGYGISRVSCPSFQLRILFSPVRQGRGGNQKLAYQYALENKFDFVALWNCDGQCPPESLPEMLMSLQRNNAGAVFGLRAGAPPRNVGMGRGLLGRFVNGLVRWAGNRLLHAGLNDYDCRYRVYSVSALRCLPFDRNSDDSRFDIEIVIQLLIAGWPISELPTAASAGDAVKHAMPLRSSAALLVVAVKARLQELSLFYDRRFDCASADSYSPYSPKLDFESPHSSAFDRIRPYSGVLDLGCARGYLGSELRKKKQCRVTGVDTRALEPGVLDEFYVADLNSGAPRINVRAFDVVLLLDVVEHLHRPELFLEDLRRKMALNPSLELMISTGNIACFVTRTMLLLGQFNYGMRGILDITHTRLFTFASFRRALDQAGFDVIETKGIPAPYPLAIGDSRLSRALLGINHFLIGLSRGLFSYQIFIRAKARPSLELLLADVERESGARASLIALENSVARGECQRTAGGEPVECPGERVSI